MKKLIVVVVLLAVTATTALAAGIAAKDFFGLAGSLYDIVWDGWKGQLILKPVPTTGTGLTGELIQGVNHFAVRGQVLANPQDYIQGYGPGYLTPSSLNHRIVFWVDFSKTPGNLQDDQKFDGYIMTQTRNAIAGVTWWAKIPFGFYAVKVLDYQIIK